MAIRTDLCLESASFLRNPIRGVTCETKKEGEALITRMQVRTKEAAKRLKKEKGTYITFQLPHFAHNPVNSKEAVEALAAAIKEMLPRAGSILVLGVGNRSITPDSLGPRTADRILATAHLPENLSFRKVHVLTPGVMGQTGMELAGLMRQLADAFEPAALIAIDALAAIEPENLGCTVQISDSGISPGSGVANDRKALTFSSIGVPVIGIGVPTVIDATALLSGFSGQKEVLFTSVHAKNLMVTPRDVDLMVQRASIFLSNAINCALQEALTVEELHYLLA